MRNKFASLLLLLLFAVAAPVPGAAQEAEAPPPTAAEQARALVEALRDENARKALIGELERIADVAPAPGEAQTGPEAIEEKPKPRSIIRALAETTSNAARNVADSLSAFWSRLANAPALFGGLSGDEAGVLWDAFLELALIIAATVVAFFVLRGLGKRFDRRLGARASESSLIATTFLVVGSIILDLIVVALAYAAGYLIATALIGEFGAIEVRQALYLNAFLVVETVKVAVRTVLSPTTRGLRPISLPDAAARKLNVWLSVIISVLGYGQLLIVPIINQQISFFAGQSIGVLISVIAVMLLLTMVLRNRRGVSDWLLGARHMEHGPQFLRMFARNWHMPVVLYLVALLLIVITRPGQILLPVLGASGQILAAIIVGSMAASAISRSIRQGIHLPQHVNARLPLLERRLNAFVPKALTALRIVIVFAVLAFALHTIGVIDLWGWLEGQVGAQVSAVVASVGLILLGAFCVWLAFSSWIDYRLNPDYGAVPSARERTLLSLAKNALTIVLLAITLMFVLSEIGIDIAPLIASAGVLGLAIGFGAQKLVQDIITGIFIQFENAMNVGDVVQVGGTTGTVERLTIRSVSLRDLHGAFHIIPFSSVDMVSNFMRGYGHYVCDMGIAYREDIEAAKQAMFDGFEELRGMEAHKNDILEDMTWFGLQTFGDSAIVVRSRIKCAPGKQWAVGRAYNAILKRIFDERDIEIPFPHQTIYFGVDQKGAAPPVHVQLDGPAASKEKPEPEKAAEGDGAAKDEAAEEATSPRPPAKE